jgi:hypothetical protein
MGPGWKGAGPGYSGIGNLGQALNGYAFSTPAEIFQFEVRQDVQRFIGVLSLVVRGLFVVWVGGCWVGA